jgi:NAD(P)-dependent dehydrogenase (short-subunit alcohol dehydrogenase family)
MAKIALVSGATNGIGIWTALGLAQQGYTVGIVARDRIRGEERRAWLAERAPAAQIDLFVADLSSLAAVRRLAGEVAARYPRLDLLVNNAGLIRPARELTDEGFERICAVNLLAPFLLSLELLDLLKRSAPARIVNVGSDSSDRATLDLDNLQAEKRFSFMGAYSQSKLAIMMTSFELARRLEGSGITVNVVHPGVVATNIFNNFNTGGWRSAVLAVLTPVARLFLLTEEQGAQTTLHVATAPEVGGVTGRYFKKSKVAPHNPIADDRALSARLWEKAMALTGAPSA